ncbi:MAG: dihydroorotate dehydrogenase-like protein, partial [Chloroflexota bacterium]
MDLSTTYLGLNLRTPLVVSASPMQEELHNIIEMVDAGASAIVLHSLFEEQLVTEQHELFFHLTHGTDSFAEALSYFPEPDDLETGPDRYLQHIQAAKAAVDVPIIASLNGSTMGGWTAFAKQIEEAGADALELNIYNIPTDIDTTGAQVEAGYMEIARAVRAAVDIPISVKLSPFFSSIPNIAKQFDEAKIDGLVLFNRFYQPDFDIDEL